MKFSLVFTIATVAAMPALAHTGHVVDAAGHNHWLGLAAAGAAVAVAVWAGIKAKSKEQAEAEEAEETADDELQEA